jgi:hypothetical protein
MNWLSAGMGFAAVVGMLFWGYQYREVHLPEFKSLKQQSACMMCMDDCMRLTNGDEQRCNIHCARYCQ